MIIREQWFLQTITRHAYRSHRSCYAPRMPHKFMPLERPSKNPQVCCEDAAFQRHVVADARSFHAQAMAAVVAAVRVNQLMPAAEVVQLEACVAQLQVCLLFLTVFRQIRLSRATGCVGC